MPRTPEGPTQTHHQLRKHRLRLTLLASALLASCNGGVSSSVIPSAALVGSWQLVSYEDRDDHGRVVHPYGDAPAGRLIYDTAGRMAVQMMKQPPPEVASDDWDEFTVEEKVALFDGYVAYFGRYEFDAARSVVTHLPEADLSRLYIGRREERHVDELDGDRLVLSEQWTQGSQRWSGVRVFRRLRDREITR